MFDSIRTYNDLEQAAFKTLPIRALQAFGCFAFNQFGYPSRVNDLRELWRFIDVMHEGDFQRQLNVLSKVSEEELELAAWLARGTFEYSTTNFGLPLTGRHCITAALIQLRGIRRVDALPPPAVAKILELGPGSGYLSLLLARLGYAVDTVEVAQAFALHQAHFFRHFLPDSALGFADSGYQYNPLDPPRHGGIRQIPWWSYGDNGPIRHRYELLTANHALAEFHPDGLLYLMKRYGAEHFGRFGESPKIFADTFGYAVTPYRDIESRLNQYGWAYDRRAPFYFITYDPTRARDQALESEQNATYEKSLRRKIKRAIYLTMRERPKKSVLRATGSECENSSIERLRGVFDELVPGERTPDEEYIETRPL